MNKDLGNYVARYEEIQKEYLAIKEEVKMEVLRAETFASLPKEEIVRKLNYSILNSNQTTIVKEIQGIINDEDDIKKVFDVFKVHFYDAKDIVFDDLKTMFPFWISVVLEGRRSLYISCYKLFLEKIIQQFRFDEIVKSNRILIANFISEIEEHFEKINKKLYPEANISKLKKIKENTINEVNRLDVAKLNPNSLKVIKNKYLRQVKGVKTFAQIKRAKRRRITAIIIAILVVIAVVLIGFIPRVDYRIVSFENIKYNINNFKEELRAYHDYDDEDMALYEPAGYYNYQTVAEVVGVRGLIWESFFSPSKLEIDNEYEGYPVASIANSAFRDLDSLEEIVLSNNIAYIGSDAFKNCTNLTTVKTNEKQQLPNELIAIGKTAFENTKIDKIRVFSTIEVMYNDSFDSKTTVLSENQSSYFDAICIGRPQFKTSFAEVKIIVVDTFENEEKPPFDSYSEFFVPGGSTQFVIHSLPQHMGYELDGFTFYGKDELVADEYGVYNGEPVTETIYLFTKYTIIEYSLDLVFNGGTEISYLDVFTVEKPYSLPEITRTGYTFEGWYSSPTYATDKKCTSTSGIYKDVKLYAKFTPNKYEITYDQDSFDLTLDYNYEGSTNKVYNVTSAQTITYPEPTRSGYIFTGWYTDEDCTEYFDTDTAIYENTTLYAGWKSYSSGYDVTIIDPSGYTSSNVYSHYISSSSSNSNPYYIYFRINETGTYNMYYSTQYSNFDYQVYWGLYNVTSGTTIRSTVLTYSSSYVSLSFTANAGDIIRIHVYDYYYSTYFYFYFSGMHSDGDIQLGAVQTVTYDKDFEISYKEKQGYTFEGYYTGKNGTGTQITDSEGKSLNVYNYPEDIQIYPYYKCITYDITYDLDGGSTSEDFVDTYTVITPTITLPTLTKTGYSFEGWYVNDTEDVITEIELGSYGELNLTAKFTPNEYNIDYGNEFEITFDYNYSGLTNKVYNISSSQEISYPEPTRSGYIFTGWYTDEDCTEYFDTNTVINESTTLYAGWHSYSSGYSTNIIDPSDYASNYAYSLYINSGSYSSNPHYIYFRINETGTYNMYYKTQYSNSQYAVYWGLYNVTSGTTIRSTGLTYSTSYSSLSFTANAGDVIRINAYDYYYSTYFYFYFSGMESDGDIQLVTECVAKYEEDFEIDYEEKPGYRFKGYFTGLNGGGTQITDGEGKSLVAYNYLTDIKVYPYYEYATYTIEYDTNDGETSDTYVETYTIDTPTFSLPILTKTGYTFDGWFASGSDEPIEQIELGSYGDLELTAKFTGHEYKISYDATITLTLNYNYSGSTNKVYNISSSDEISYPEPTRSGYVFRGWFTDEDCTEYFDTNTVINESTTLYAGWQSYSSGYSTYIIDPFDYTSSYAYSLYISSGSYSSYPHYIYFRINETGTYNMYYKTEYSNSNYGVNWGLYNVTSGTTIRSTGLTYSSSYSSLSFTANAGDVIRINAYDNYYTTYFYFYFGGFKSDGNISLESFQVVNYGSEFEMLYIEKPGYRFKGYFTGLNGGGTQITDGEGKSLVAYNYLNDITVYPYYEYGTYTIEYNANDGETSDTYVETYTIDTPTFSLPILTKTGYTFDGWFASGSDEPIEQIELGSYGDLELIAKFTGNEYEITFTDKIDLTLDYNYNGSINTIYTITDFQDITYPEPTRSGYVFRGWFTDEDCTEYFDTDTVIYENTTLYAGWQSYYSGYTTNIIDPSDYTSSYDVYSQYISSSSYSSNPHYIYFRINETGTYNMYYKTQSSDSYYGVYWGLYNVTSGTTIRSTSLTYGSSYYSLSFTANAGDVIRINAYYYYYSTYFYFYFSEMESDSDIQLGISKTVTYNSDFELPYSEKTNFTFKGYYTGENGTGTKITDETGASLVPYNFTSDIELYAYYE